MSARKKAFVPVLAALCAATPGMPGTAAASECLDRIETEIRRGTAVEVHFGDGRSESWIFRETGRNPDRLHLTAPPSASDSVATLALAPSEFVSVSFYRELRWKPVVIGLVGGAALGALGGSLAEPSEFPAVTVGAIAGATIGFLGGVMWTFPGTKTVHCAP